jgi:choline dehydrogenase-like flavoprotein
LLTLYAQLDHVTPPADGHNTIGEFLPNLHPNSKAPIGTSLLNFPISITSRILQTLQQIPSQFPFNLDMNSGSPLGFGTLVFLRTSVFILNRELFKGWNQWTIKNGARVTAASAFVDPALSRSNFDVLINTQVTKVLKTGVENGMPVFGAVELAQSSQGMYLLLRYQRV